MSLHFTLIRFPIHKCNIKPCNKQGAYSSAFVLNHSAIESFFICRSPHCVEFISATIQKHRSALPVDDLSVLQSDATAHRVNQKRVGKWLEFEYIKAMKVLSFAGASKHNVIQ